MADRALPLTETRWTLAAFDADREAEIGRLVDAFYDAVRRDDLIGPIFEARVTDWDAHLSRMRDFWVSAIYRAGRYAGRPIEVHRAIADLGPAHFDRWLELWEQTVAGVVESDAADDLRRFARVMATTMIARLGIADATE